MTADKLSSPAGPQPAPEPEPEPTPRTPGSGAGWRLVDENTPRDGTPILLGRPAIPETETDDEYVAVSTLGWWVEAEPDGQDYMGADAGFVDHEYSVFWPGRSFGNPKYQREANQPTHWMPHPEPPKGASSGET